ncbi:hypothetical protein ACIP2Z_01680 [Streptomyces iakyrus]|uniref:4Fe-4S Mo/W bis-MGD-type domain-containing protein n=1 Tax=Streptomyces iakyrus TaxID=68219 RepID=A0ABW8F6J1_9ACTN
MFGERDPKWEGFYRDRWSHDKVVRSTHGVNCTGSCFVDGVRQGRHDHLRAPGHRLPVLGTDCPEYEPRGCLRGASFSWYTYSPRRVRYPYVRGVLLKLWREARKRLGDPVAAWAEITGAPAKARAYKRARGKGGLAGSRGGEAPLRQHRRGLELIHRALTDADSPYRHVLAALLTLLPPPTEADRAAVTRLVAEGPPNEEVGLDPYGTYGEGEFAPAGTFAPPMDAVPTRVPPVGTTTSRMQGTR